MNQRGAVDPDFGLMVGVALAVVLFFGILIYTTTKDNKYKSGCLKAGGQVWRQEGMSDLFCLKVYTFVEVPK